MRAAAARICEASGADARATQSCTCTYVYICARRSAQVRETDAAAKAFRGCVEIEEEEEEVECEQLPEEKCH